MKQKKNGFYKNGEKLIKKRWIIIGNKLITIPWHGGSPKNAVSILIILFGLVFIALMILNNPIFFHTIE